MSYCVVLVTVPKKGEARQLASFLLQEKLCACVNIISGVSSFFWWESKIDSAEELLLVIKTRRSLVKKLITAVRSKHSYTVPEIIALPILAGNKDYLAWVAKETV